MLAVGRVRRRQHRLSRDQFVKDVERLGPSRRRLDSSGCWQTTRDPTSSAGFGRLRHVDITTLFSPTTCPYSLLRGGRRVSTTAQPICRVIRLRLCVSPATSGVRRVFV